FPARPTITSCFFLWQFANSGSEPLRHKTEPIMPGITGIILKSGRNPYQEEHASMIAAMKHEPFYTSGMYYDERVNVRLGWVVQTNSFCDCLPVMNERRDLALVFYGEDFPRKSTRYRDARYLVDLYEEMGESFLLELNGSFAG